MKGQEHTAKERTAIEQKIAQLKIQCRELKQNRHNDDDKLLEIIHINDDIAELNHQLGRPLSGLYK